MSSSVETLPTRVHTTEDGRAVIEQPNNAIVLSDEQILAVIRELHVCYDYCAAWKEADPDGVSVDGDIGAAGSKTASTE